MNVTTDLLEELAASSPKPSSATTPATDSREPAPKTTGPRVERPAKRLLRGLGFALAALAALGLVAGSALAAGATVKIASGRVAINTKAKTFSLPVTCVSDADPCAGVLDVKTAGKIKPYSSSPAQVAKVGTFPFTVPAGKTALVKGRVYGPALAEAMLRGKVKLSVVARLGTPEAAGSRIVLFTYKRR